MKNKQWLIVDLDESLLKTDLFVEQLLRALLTRPLLLAKLVFKSSFSIPRLKCLIADNLEVSYEHLPYNQSVVQKIEAAKKDGWKIVLATAAAETHAKAVSEKFPLFDEVLATTETENLKGEQKLQRIQSLVGDDSFEYIGDSISDVPLFRDSKKFYLVNPNKKLLKTCDSFDVPHEVLDSSRESIWDYDSKLLRPYQWMKNIVFFLPAVTSIGLYDVNNLWLVAPTFTVMSLLASFVYIMNDLADIESDRRHPDKCKRSFAAGEASVKFGFFTGVSLLLLALIILLVWHPTTCIYFAVYLVLTVAYTMYLKEVAILDIFVLVSFYILRVMIGIETLEVRYSIWFISFCFLMFANLAFLKRFIEVNKDTKHKNSRRNYDARDKEFLRTSGLAAIFASIVLLLIYSKSADFTEFYSNEDLFTVLCLPYGMLMLRMWYLASRNLVDSDPLVYTIRSPFSYLAVFVSCFILYFSR